MVKNIYKWNGEIVKVVFGYCKVKENEKPMCWYNFECCNVLERNYGIALIPAIKINSNAQRVTRSNDPVIS